MMLDIFGFVLDAPFVIAILAVLFVADVLFFSFEKYAASVLVMIGSIVAAYFFSPQLKQFVHSDLTHILLWYVPMYLGVGLGTAVIKWFIHNLKYVGSIREVKGEFDKLPWPPKEESKSPRSGRRNSVEDDYAERQRQGIVEPKPKELTAEEVAAAKVVADKDNLVARRKAFLEFYKSPSYGSDGDLRRNHKIYSVPDMSADTAIVDALTPRAKDNVGIIALWIFQWPVVIVSTLFSDFLVKLAKNVARVLDVVFSKFTRALVARVTKGL